MKPSTQSTFDTSQIADTKTFEEVPQFFDYVNKLADDVVTALNKNITLSDNLKISFYDLSVTHGKPIVFAAKPSFITLKCTTPILTYQLSETDDGRARLVVYFKKAINIKAIRAEWQSGTFVRYLVSDTSNISIGDFVTVSGFGTSNNNGTFLVTEIDGDYLYLLNRKRTSATGDEIRQTYAGQVESPISVRVGVYL